MRSPMVFLQPLGRALMLPIAVLPVAGLLLRLGQPDLLDIAFLSAAGNALFDNLGLLFAVGVATGFARDGNGAACLAGLVCYFVIGDTAQTFVIVPADALAGAAPAQIATLEAAARAAAIHKFDVPIGIVAGIVGGLFYNRFATFKLPEYLAFFSGRRFVPIISGLAGLVFGAIIGLAYPWIAEGIDSFSRLVIGSGGWGLFVFGLLNRLLIVTGLHHILNNVAYFVVGDYGGVTGDLRRFFAGDPSAGITMSGFFPIMMFGLPAACLAMYHEVPKPRRAAAGGLLLSLALTSFLTGVTEPIEFSFMFVAPVLYLIHAVLTGLAEVIMYTLGVRMGYGFSAGLFDYVLNFGLATRPLLLLPVGAAYALVYYVIFRFAIRRWNLATPGREEAEGGPGPAPALSGGAERGERGPAFARALGGKANLIEVAACTTRLRLVVADQDAVDPQALKALGARGVLRPSARELQVVLGPIADMVAMEIREAIDGGAVAATPYPVETAPRPSGAALPGTLAAPLGGADNIVDARRYHGRWRIQLKDPGLAAWDRIAQDVRSIARPMPDIVHLLVAGDDEGRGKAQGAPE